VLAPPATLRHAAARLSTREGFPRPYGRVTATPAHRGPFLTHGKLVTGTGTFSLSTTTGAIVGWNIHVYVGSEGLLGEQGGPGLAAERLGGPEPALPIAEAPFGEARRGENPVLQVI